MNFIIFSLKVCQNIFETRSCSPLDQSGWASHDFSNLDYSESLELTKCILVRPFRPTKWFFQIYPAFFLKCSWNPLSRKVLFVIFWYQMSPKWFFKFWHTLSLVCFASSEINSNLKIYSLEKWLFGTLGIFLDWPSSSYLSNSILFTL